MPVTLLLDDARQIAELRVVGQVLWEDFHRIAPELERFIQSHDTVRLLEVIEDFRGLDPHLQWDGLRFDRKIVPHISHCAIVGDLAWLSPLDKAREALRPMELRLYPHRLEPMARLWVERAGRGKTHVVDYAPSTAARAGRTGARKALPSAAP